jgi:hypothetical protein
MATIHEDKFHAYMKRQIASRYARPSNIPGEALESLILYLNNLDTEGKPIIIDSLFPEILIRNIDIKFEELYKVFEHLELVSISRFISEVLNIPQITPSQMRYELNIDNLDEVISTNKSLPDNEFLTSYYPVTFIGAGGTVHNTAYWCHYLSRYNINVREIWDDDVVTFDNMLRFPSEVSKYSSDYKSLVIKRPPLGDISTYIRRIRENDLQENVLYYGAPDIATREMLQNSHFLAATHAGNTADITYKPIQDRYLQFESYGSIRLDYFFMNQAAMAMKFMEIYNNIALTNSISYTENEKLWEYSFTPRDDSNFYWLNQLEYAHISY